MVELLLAVDAGIPPWAKKWRRRAGEGGIYFRKRFERRFTPPIAWRRCIGSLRKIIKTRGSFPNEESALKLLFLAIRQAAKKSLPPPCEKSACSSCREWRNSPAT